MDKGVLILKHLKENPFMSQQQLAKKVNLSRSAVANYIAELTRQGQIKGRAYILCDDKTITCIGGANIDRKASAKANICYHSSNPVTMTESFGGVARNVAENLSKLDNKVSLLTVVGNDKEGQSILEDTKRKNIDVHLTEVIPEARTGTYTALLDLSGEMVISLADMDINHQLTATSIEKKWSHIASSQIIFVDTNIPEETLAYLIKRCAKDQLPLYVDPVSSIKSKKLPQDLTGVELILPNLEEAEELAGMKIEAPADYAIAASIIKGRGAKNVVITLGSDGIFFCSPNDSGHLPIYKINCIDVTGAGDALAAGILSSMAHGHELRKACQYGLAAAAFTLNTKQSVSPYLSIENIKALIINPQSSPLQKDREGE